jgi:hypothetical protein
MTWVVPAIAVGGIVAVGVVGKFFYDQVPAYHDYVEAERELQWTVGKYFGLPLLGLTLAGTAGIAYMIANAKVTTVQHAPGKGPTT